MAGAIMEKASREPRLSPVPGALGQYERRPTPIRKALTLGACEYCGHCERFGCEANAKASPQACILPVLLADDRFELRTHAYVKELVYDRPARKVKAVRYVDTRSGEEFEQPAGLVILGAYVFNNVLLMLHGRHRRALRSQNRQGRASARTTATRSAATACTVFFEDKEINPFMAAGAHGGMNIDDFNGDNFDHSGLGFFGGAWISAGTVQWPADPDSRPVPPGTPRWGRDWKQATAKWYNHAFNIGASGCNYAHRENYLDLDPTYRDALGRPLIRMTYNFHENDYKLSDYIGGVLGRIAKAMNPTIMSSPAVRRGNYNVVPYQSTHNTGGTITGNNPKTSVVNRYLQSWDADNLFVMGASVFPQNASYNPTGVVGALAYCSAQAITTQYLKTQGRWSTREGRARRRRRDLRASRHCAERNAHLPLPIVLHDGERVGVRGRRSHGRFGPIFFAAARNGTVPQGPHALLPLTLALSPRREERRGERGRAYPSRVAEGDCVVNRCSHARFAAPAGMTHAGPF